MSIVGPTNFNISSLLTTDLHVDGSNSMIASLNMNNNKILNLIDPINSKDAVTKVYCDTNSIVSESNCLSVHGENSMEADINMNDNKIINLLDPVNNQDAATKNYIDTKYNGDNIFIGNLSGNTSASGTYNIAMGFQSLKSITSGGGNISFGPDALLNTTEGSFNVGIGYNSLSHITTGIIIRQLELIHYQ